MKISPETNTILKNFAHINQSLFFKKGNVISTMSPQKNILVDATISETIPRDLVSTILIISYLLCLYLKMVQN